MTNGQNGNHKPTTDQRRAMAKIARRCSTGA